MDMFSALAEPTRRNILELLANSGQLSSSDISNKFHISSPAISQHLKVLRDANLVSVEKRAQQRIYTINPLKISELEEWLKKLTKQWEERFSRLDKILDIEKEKLRRGGVKK
jgi:DNA-binding transcriptional ArsR family regulator